MGEHERILLQGQLMLLDTDTMQPKHYVYMVLFNNNLLIGHPAIGNGVTQQKHSFNLVHLDKKT